MSAQKSSEDQEIDLSAITRVIVNFLGGIGRSVFNVIQFGIKKIVIIGILIIAGAGIGIYMDKTQKLYNHEIIVAPNFGCRDYLYSKIDLIMSKIKEKDTLFLKSIGIINPSRLSKIEIEPIIDVYQFINNEQNFQLLKLMAEDGDLKKIIEEKTTSKNYPNHLISFTTKNVTSDKETVEPIMVYLNNSDYYKKLQKEYINNLQIKMKADEAVISQIDGFLNSFSNTVNGNSKSDKLVYYNENTQLNDVIKTKDKFVEELGTIRLNLVGFDEIIKKNSSTTNVENTTSTNGKLKYILPFLFLSIYIFIYIFSRFYRKQSLKSTQK